MTELQRTIDRDDRRVKAAAALASASRLDNAYDWPEPDLQILNGGKLAAPPPPLHLIGEPFEKQITHIATCKAAPPDYVMATVLSAAASIIGNARWFEAWSGWQEPAGVWFCLVGGPSSGKSPAADPALKLLSNIEASRSGAFKAALRKHAADTEKAKLADDEWREAVRTAYSSGLEPPLQPDDAIVPEPPVRPRAVVQDITTEELAAVLQANPKGCLQFRDEMSGFLAAHGRYGNDADRPFYLEAYGGRRYTVDRRKNPDPIVIPRLTLSICGGIQPDKLNGLLIASDDDGLAARFLYVWPDPVRPERPAEALDLSSLEHAFVRLETLAPEERDGELEPVIMRLADGDLHNEWGQKLYDEYTDVEGAFGSFIGKLRGVTLRLAGIFELMNWAMSDRDTPPAYIATTTLKKAIEFVETYIIPMSKRVFCEVAIPQAERHATQTAKYIRKHEIRELNSRTARQDWGLSGMRKAEDFDRALKHLQVIGWVRPSPSREGSTKGRVRKDYLVNPRVFTSSLGAER
ncbi:MAG: DUF3987 domain-containing protein [Parvularcula sp.]|jgi:hypothetical protein|nr:DUF3987 domain-containing protein [Parvularcula sp.]